MIFLDLCISIIFTDFCVHLVYSELRYEESSKAVKIRIHWPNQTFFFKVCKFVVFSEHHGYSFPDCNIQYSHSMKTYTYLKSRYYTLTNITICHQIPVSIFVLHRKYIYNNTYALLKTFHFTEFQRKCWVSKSTNWCMFIFHLSDLANYVRSCQYDCHTYKQ